MTPEQIRALADAIARARAEAGQLRAGAFTMTRKEIEDGAGALEAVLQAAESALRAGEG